MDVQQLVVFAEVVRTGSYTAAAATLGYTQPAVSYHMRLLQRRLGAPVVVRAGRRLQLTDAGRTLLRHTDAILSAVRTAERDMATVMARGGGVVRVTAFQSACVTLLPAVVTRLRSSHPDVRVTVEQAEPARARDLLRSGEADVGVLCNWSNEDLPEGEAAMLRVDLMTDRRCVVMRDDHPLAGRDSIELADLAGADWVMEAARDRFTAACAARGFAPRVVGTVDDVLTIQGLIVAGLGIGLLSELALAGHLPPPLVHRPLSDWPLRRTYALVWPDMLDVTAVAAVLEAARDAVGRLRTRPDPAADPEGR